MGASVFWTNALLKTLSKLATLYQSCQEMYRGNGKIVKKV